MSRGMDAQSRKYVGLIIAVIGLAVMIFNGVSYFQLKGEYDDLVKSCTEKVNGVVTSCDPYTVKRRKRISKHSHKTVTETYYKTTVSFEVNGEEFYS